MHAGQIAVLKISDRDGKIKDFPLTDGKSYKIGRAEASDIQIDDPSVSRVHAMLTVSNTGVVVSDLTSTNGTFVNGKKISIPYDLRTGDIVDIGPVKLSLVLESSEATTLQKGRTMTAQLRPSTAIALLLRIKRYPELVEKFTEQHVEPVTDFWSKQVAAVVEELGGKVDKVLHGSVVGLWYGLDAGKVAGHAAQAAFRLIESTAALSETARWPHHKEVPLECQAFLHSGMALMGTVGGASGVKDFAVLGDTVNDLFALSQSAEKLPGACYASETVAQFLASTFRPSRVSGHPFQGTSGLLHLFSIEQG